MSERTLLLIKPDGVERGLVGEILRRCERRDLEPIQLDRRQPTEEVVAAHYKEHRDEPFYDNLLDYLVGEPVVATVLEGRNAITVLRKLIGDTEPVEAASGTIRGDYGTDSYEVADAEDRAVENLVHASDSPEAAEREIALWFGPDRTESERSESITES